MVAVAVGRERLIDNRKRRTEGMTWSLKCWIFREMIPRYYCEDRPQRGQDSKISRKIEATFLHA